jgi:hypothetical protein
VPECRATNAPRLLVGDDEAVRTIAAAIAEAAVRELAARREKRNQDEHGREESNDRLEHHVA